MTLRGSFKSNADAKMTVSRLFNVISEAEVTFRFPLPVNAAVAVTRPGAFVSTHRTTIVSEITRLRSLVRFFSSDRGIALPLRTSIAWGVMNRPRGG